MNKVQKIFLSLLCGAFFAFSIQTAQIEKQDAFRIPKDSFLMQFYLRHPRTVRNVVISLVLLCGFISAAWQLRSRYQKIMQAIQDPDKKDEKQSSDQNDNSEKLNEKIEPSPVVIVKDQNKDQIFVESSSSEDGSSLESDSSDIEHKIPTSDEPKEKKDDSSDKKDLDPRPVQEKFKSSFLKNVELSEPLKEKLQPIKTIKTGDKNTLVVKTRQGAEHPIKPGYIFLYSDPITKKKTLFLYTINGKNIAEVSQFWPVHYRQNQNGQFIKEDPLDRENELIDPLEYNQEDDSFSDFFDSQKLENNTKNFPGSQGQVPQPIQKEPLMTIKDPKNGTIHEVWEEKHS